MEQAFHHIKPGGYIELMESAMWAWSSDGSLKDDSPYMQFLRYLNEAAEKTDRKLNVVDELKQWMADGGFEDVKQDVRYIPWVKDPAMKELGKWESFLAPDFVEAYGLRLYTQILGWSLDEAKIHLWLKTNLPAERCTLFRKCNLEAPQEDTVVFFHKTIICRRQPYIGVGAQPGYLAFVRILLRNEF